MNTVDVLLTVIRILVGLLFIGHGAQKLFGWFGGQGIAGATKMTTNLGFRPAGLWAVMNALSEFVGGILLTLGFLTPLGAALVIGVMLTAIIKVHAANGLWVTGGGYEYNLLIIANALLVGLTAPVQFSVDHYMNYPWTTQQIFAVSIVIIVIGLFVSALMSASGKPNTTQTTTT